jgi:hypothetical protein
MFEGNGDATCAAAARDARLTGKIDEWLPGEPASGAAR